MGGYSQQCRYCPKWFINSQGLSDHERSHAMTASKAGKPMPTLRAGDYDCNVHREGESIFRVREDLYSAKIVEALRTGLSASEARAAEAEAASNKRFEAVHATLEEEIRENHKRAYKIMDLEAKLSAAELDAGRYRDLKAAMTFYDTAESSGPVLASVSKRIWYHATDCLEYPLDAVADALRRSAP